MDKEQIDRLTYKPGRENKWVKFNSLDRYSHNYLIQAGPNNCVRLGDSGNIIYATNKETLFEDEWRYLLKPDYVPERETVDIDILLSGIHWVYNDPISGIVWSLNNAMSHKDFKHYLWPNGDTSRFLEWKVTDKVKVVFYKD